MLAIDMITDAPVAGHLRRVDKLVEPAMLRTADAIAQWHVRRLTRRILPGSMKIWFSKRESKIAASLINYTNRFKGRRRGSEIVDAFGGKRRDLRAIESGGTYEQWVQEHTRSRRGRGAAANSNRVNVKGYRRNVRQPAQMYFVRVIRDLHPYINIPIERAIEILMNHGRMPRRPELLKGLMR